MCVGYLFKLVILNDIGDLFKTNNREMKQLLNVEITTPRCCKLSYHTIYSNKKTIHQKGPKLAETKRWRGDES